MDSSNEYPYFDTSTWGFDWIADIALTGSGRQNLFSFYYISPIEDKHDTLRSIWQNAIDYDQAPTANSIPQVKVLQNMTRVNILDLKNYTSDPESPDSLLIYTLVSQSNSNCGVSFNASLVTVSPTNNWIGTCTITYRVSDTLKSITSSFGVTILAITDRIYLPIVVK